MMDGAIYIAENELTFQPNLVCVVENGFFDAVAYCYSEREFQDFNDPSDYRIKHWLVYAHAETLAK